MFSSRDLLAAIRSAHGITSNYRLARFLDLPEQSVQRWNTNRHTPDDATAVRLAGLAGLDPAHVLACMHAQRCTDDGLRPVLVQIAERARAVAAVLLAAILSGFISGGPDAQARAVAEQLAAVLSGPSVAQNIHWRGMLALFRRLSPKRRVIPGFAFGGLNVG